MKGNPLRGQNVEHGIWLFILLGKIICWRSDIHKFLEISNQVHD